MWESSFVKIRSFIFFQIFCQACVEAWLFTVKDSLVVLKNVQLTLSASQNDAIL